MSLNLKRVCGYVYKPSDVISNWNKVDYLGCLGGRFLALEAKATEGRTLPGSVVTPNQRLVLEQVAEDGGIAVVAINFSRNEPRNPRGYLKLYRCPLDWTQGFKLYDDTPQIERVAGGGWRIEDFFSTL